MVPVPVAPSPKFQLTVYGKVPPVVTAVRVTGVFTNGLVGRKAKLVVRGQLVTQSGLKALSRFGAAASLDVSEVSPQAASIVDKYE
jgi:hypothetical protein